MTVKLILSTYEVMVEANTGELSTPYYPGVTRDDRRYEFSSLDQAEAWVERYWPMAYQRHNPGRTPVIVKCA